MQELRVAALPARVRLWDAQRTAAEGTAHHMACHEALPHATCSKILPMVLKRIAGGSEAMSFCVWNSCAGGGGVSGGAARRRRTAHELTGEQRSGCIEQEIVETELEGQACAGGAVSEAVCGGAGAPSIVTPLRGRAPLGAGLTTRTAQAPAGYVLSTPLSHFLLLIGAIVTRKASWS